MVAVKSVTKNYIIQSQERKKIGKNIGKNKQEKTGYQSYNTTSYHHTAFKNPYSNLQMHWNLLRKKNALFKVKRERKSDKYRE